MDIAVLIDFHDLNNFHKLLIDGINSYCSLNNLNVIYYTVGRFNSPLQSEYGRDEIYKIISQHKFDGLIVFSTSITNFSGPKPLLEKLQFWNNIPIVSISVELKDFYSVMIDNKPGFSALLDHLFTKHNYKRIAYISGPITNMDGRFRMDFFLKKIKEYNISFDQRNIFPGLFTVDSGKKAVEYFFDDLKTNPDLIISANDEMLVGVWRELKTRGLMVPEDVALTGFDDLEASRLFSLPFTTVKQPLFRQGYVSAKFLHDHLKDPRLKTKKITLVTKLMLRKSCGCFKQKDNIFETKDFDNYILSNDSKNAFLKKNYADFIVNLKRELDNLPGNPLFRHWNSFLLECTQFNLNYDEIREYLNSTIDSIESIEEFKLKNIEIKKYTLQLYNNLFEFYQQVDSLSQIESSRNNKVIIYKTDELVQQLIMGTDLKMAFNELPKLLQFLNIKEFYVTLYKDQGRKNGSLIFAYNEKRILIDPNRPQRYSFKNLLPEEFKNAQKSPRVVLDLYEDTNQIGFIVAGTGDNDYDVYELLRKKLSQGFNSMLYTKNLHLFNQKLEQEISSRKETEEKLKEALDKLENLSLTDELTGLNNRRGFYKLAEQQLMYCKRLQIPYTILFIDLDGLKKINDNYGHNMGDFAIRSVAEVFKSTLRQIDILSRLGGDEFTAFLTKASYDDLQIILTRLYDNLNKFNNSSGKDFQLAMSVGHYCGRTEDDYNLERMMNLADQDLYEIKKEKYRKKSDLNKNE